MSTDAGVPGDVRERAERVRLLSLDVDGVLTDGRILYSEAGDEIKAFHVQDGTAIKLLRQHGIRVVLITGRHSTIVDRRAAELGIDHVFQSVTDKASVLAGLLRELDLNAGQAAHVGDDLPDIGLFERVGLAIAVPNAHPAALARAHHVSTVAGGQGVVREVCELLLRARDAWPYG